MASRPREFDARVPVEIEVRCGWRVKLLNDVRIAEELQRIAVIEAARCKVQLHSMTVEVNHVHLCVQQGFRGHALNKKTGVAAFQRNWGSRSAKWLNGFLGLRGRFWEKVYFSWNLRDAAEVLKNVVYTVMNPVHHKAVKGAEDYPSSSVGVYFRGVPDGVVTSVSAMFRRAGTTPQERGERVRRLILEVWEEGERTGDLLEAARQALWRHRDWLDARAWRKTIPIEEWVGDEAAEGKKEEVLARVRPRAKFKPRRAPCPGQLLKICLYLEDPHPLAGVAWREWHE